MSGEPRLTRRAVLLGTLAVPLAACRSHRSPRPTAPPPDEAALAEAITREQELLRLLAGIAAPAAPDVEALSRAHSEHWLAMRRLASVSPTISPSPTSIPLRAAMSAADRVTRASIPHLQAAAIGAHSGQVAALFASIAASHANPLPEQGPSSGSASP